MGVQDILPIAVQHIQLPQTVSKKMRCQATDT